MQVVLVEAQGGVHAKSDTFSTLIRRFAIIAKNDSKRGGSVLTIVC